MQVMLGKQLRLLTTALAWVHSAFCFFSTNTVNILKEKWNTALTDGTMKLHSWEWDLCKKKIKIKQENKIVQHKEENSNNWQCKQQLCSSPSVSYITIHCVTAEWICSCETSPIPAKSVKETTSHWQAMGSHLEGCNAMLHSSVLTIFFCSDLSFDLKAWWRWPDKALLHKDRLKKRSTWRPVMWLARYNDSLHKLHRRS